MGMQDAFSQRKAVVLASLEANCGEEAEQAGRLSDSIVFSTQLGFLPLKPPPPPPPPNRQSAER